ncbi:MAG: hypothetical protein QM754_02765 [Tepidisphaeraceae bacterium]
MPFDIQGWIEFAYTVDLEDENAWFGAIDLETMGLVGDTISERLFNLSKACVAGEKCVTAVAAGRGVPANPSRRVSRDLEMIKAHNAQYGPGEYGGYTYASWPELKAVLFGDDELEESGWKLVFALANQLEQRVPASHIRFVVWFEW